MHVKLLQHNSNLASWVEIKKAHLNRHCLMQEDSRGFKLFFFT